MERLHQTREEAIKWHRKMWAEMGIIEGDDCLFTDRISFKKRYIQENFPGVYVLNDCFLCNYALEKAYDNLKEKFGLIDLDDAHKYMCKYCPLKWGDIEDFFDCEYSNISWIYNQCSLIAGLEERTDNI